MIENDYLVCCKADRDLAEYHAKLKQDAEQALRLDAAWRATMKEHTPASEATVEMPKGTRALPRYPLRYVGIAGSYTPCPFCLHFYWKCYRALPVKDVLRIRPSLVIDTEPNARGFYHPRVDECCYCGAVVALWT